MLEILKQLKTALLLLVIFTVITGLIYPLVVTGIAQVFFPWRANGSLIADNNQLIGSELIGQVWSNPNYFWSRPSATLPFPYNAASSSGSNLGPSNPTLLANIKNRILNLQNADPQNKNLIPIDLVTTSASGLDPEISPEAAVYQIPRIAKARDLSEDEIQALVFNSIKPRTLGILGEPRINVLQLNLALDQLAIRNMHERTASKS